MLHYLLARHGITFVEPEGFSILTHYLMERGAVVCQGCHCTSSGMSTERPEAKHVASRLMRESLVDKSVIASTESPVRAILPHVNVIKIGGRSSVLPLLDEIVENQAKYTQILGVGAGIRSRHILSVGLDLGLPTGVLATLSAKDAAHNAYMVSCLLARHGFVALEAPFLVQLLPAMLAAARGANFNGVPPYDLWEHPPISGKIPPHRTDTGSYLVAEVFGARSMIVVKDVDGLYTADPATDPHARLIPRIRAAELVALNLPTLPIDRVVPELIQWARLATEVQIIDGRVPGNLTRALKGEHVGSIIDKLSSRHDRGAPG
jgi:molybdenum storage protein